MLQSNRFFSKNANNSDCFLFWVWGKKNEAFPERRVGQWDGGRTFRGDGEEGRAGGDGVGFGVRIEAN